MIESLAENLILKRRLIDFKKLKSNFGSISEFNEEITKNRLEYSPLPKLPHALNLTDDLNEKSKKIKNMKNNILDNSRVLNTNDKNLIKQTQKDQISVGHSSHIITCAQSRRKENCEVTNNNNLNPENKYLDRNYVLKLIIKQKDSLISKNIISKQNLVELNKEKFIKLTNSI